MNHKKAIFKRVVSLDGKTVAEAYSEASTDGDSNSTIHQNVTVRISSGNGYSSSSGSSSSSSSSASN
jgi:hypothetical protein